MRTASLGDTHGHLAASEARALRGGDLHGRDLRGADLRGRDLRDADLRGADLRNVRTGLRPPIAALVLVVALGVSVGLGVLTGHASARIMALMSASDPLVHTLGLLLAAAIAESLIALVWRGGRFTLRAVVAPLSVFAALSAIIAIATGLGSGTHVLAFSTLLLLVCAITILATLARASAGAFGSWAFLVVAVSGAFAGKLSGGGFLAVCIALAAMLAGRRALSGSAEFEWLARAARRLVTRYGTRLSGADLRGAKLEGTTLVACDLRGTKLEGASFEHERAEHCLFDDEGDPLAGSSTIRRRVQTSPARTAARRY